MSTNWTQRIQDDRDTKTLLAQKLEDLCMTPETLADHVDISPRQLRRIASGTVERPRIRTVRRLSDAIKDLEKQMHETGGRPPWL
jgi:predicted transcriptional regulator